MTIDEDQDKTIVHILKENDISLSVLNDRNHPDFSRQRERLIQIVQEGHITEKRIEALANAAPSANEALRGVSHDAAASQSAAFDALKEKNSSAYIVIEKIVEKAADDELLKEALHTTERMHSADAEAVKEMNKKNNNTFKYIAGAIFTGLLLIAGGAAAKSYLSK